MKRFELFLVGSVSFLLLTSGASAQDAAPPPQGPGLTTIQERCSSCHSTATVFNQRRSADDWATTVQLMIDRGADLSADDQSVVTGYLVANYGLKQDKPLH